MPLEPELIDAYKKALYVVFLEPDLVLRIGERNAVMDALLTAHDVTTAAYVTPANPGGRKTSTSTNRAAISALRKSQIAAGYVSYPGEGRDPAGSWLAEPSVLVIGISRRDAEALGRKLEQNAIVFIEKGAAPELVVLA